MIPPYLRVRHVSHFRPARPAGRLFLLLAVACASMTPALAGVGADEKARASDRFEEVMAAERSFARDAAARGVVAAFKDAIAPDGILFRPDPVPGLTFLQSQPSSGQGPDLVWWPVHGGVALSGDLGFTTGPWEVGNGSDKRVGQYFTVWSRQADGVWRFLLDHGPPTSHERFSNETSVTRVSPGTPAPEPTTDAALQALKALEEEIAAISSADAVAALSRHLADDIWAVRFRQRPAVGREEVVALLDANPTGLTTSWLGGGISSARDLAYTYGNASWVDPEKGESRGHYIRMWQHRPEGWRIIFDEVLPVPPAS